MTAMAGRGRPTSTRHPRRWRSTLRSGPHPSTAENRSCWPRVTIRSSRPAPIVSRSSKIIEIWAVPLNGSKPAGQLFFARGQSQSPVWSPSGDRLAFVSDRGDHCFIGIFQSDSAPIRYLAPSTSRDGDPRWSPDGREILFVRQPGKGGAPKAYLSSTRTHGPSGWQRRQVERRTRHGAHPTRSPAHCPRSRTALR